MNNPSMLKKFLTTASTAILGMSTILPATEVCAAGVSTMTGNVQLSQPNVNFAPPFVNGNTIVVGAPGGFSITTNKSNAVIGAIRLDNNLNVVQWAASSGHITHMGSIAGTASLSALGIYGGGMRFVFTGTAGEGNNPPANDYSGLKAINFQRFANSLTINAPITLNATISKANVQTALNINENVIITDAGIGSVRVVNIGQPGTPKTLTLPVNKNAYSLLTAENSTINFLDPNSELALTAQVDQAITLARPISNADNSGIISLNAVGGKITLDVTNSTIGKAGRSLREFIVSGDYGVTVKKQIFATTFTNTNTNTVNLDLVTGNIQSLSNGTINVPAGVTGSVTAAGGNFTGNVTGSGSITTGTFAGNVSQNASIGAGKFTGNIGGTATFTAAGTLNTSNVGGKIDFKGFAGVVNVAAAGQIAGITSTGGPNGTLNFAGAGQAGAITNLTAVNFNGAGAVNLTGAASATTFTIGNAGANIAAAGPMTGNVNFTQNGTLAAPAGVTGSVTAAGGNFTGNVAGSGSITTGTFVGNVSQNASIGAGKFTGNIGGTATFTAAGTLNTSNVGGKIDFKGFAGVVNVAAAGQIAGITSTGGPNGTLNFAGAGQAGAITNLTAVNFNGAGAVNLTGAASATTFTIGNAGANIAAAGPMTGNVNFTQNGTLAAPAGVTGSVTAAGGNFTGNVAGSGSITTGTFVGNVSQNASIGAGKFTGNIGGTATFTAAGTLNTSNVGGKIDFKGFAGVVNVAAAGQIAGITSTGGPNGTLNFAGAGQAGAITNLTAVNFNGAGAVNLTGAASATTFTIGNAGANIAAAGPMTGNVNFTQNGTLAAPAGVTGSVTAAGGNFTGNVAGSGSITTGTFVGNVSQNASIGAGKFTGNIGGTATFTAAGTLNTSNVGGKIDFAGNDASLLLSSGGELGKIINSRRDRSNGTNGNIILLGAAQINDTISGLALLKGGAGNVNFIQPGTYFITEIQGNGLETINFPSNFGLTGGFNLTGGDAVKLNFADKTNVSDLIGTAANPVGQVIIDGTVNFSKAINSNDNVVLNPGADGQFSDEVNSVDLIADNATITALNDLVITSNIQGSNTNLAIEGNQVVIIEEPTFSDQLTIMTNYDKSTLEGGKVVINADKFIDLSQVNNILIKFTLIGDNIINNATYPLLISQNGEGIKSFSASNINLEPVEEYNNFVKWTYDINEGALTLYEQDITEEVLTEIVAFTSRQNIIFADQLLRVDDLSSEAAKFLHNLGFADLPQAREMLSNILDRPKKVSDIMHHLKGSLDGTSKAATSSIAVRTRTAAAAGDDDQKKYGIWIEPFYGKARQKSNNAEYLVGYKANNTGATIGIDGLINENLLLGAAYTGSYTDIKPQDQKAGDKTKVKTSLISLYSSYALPNNWFVEGSMAYGESRVKNYEIRDVALARRQVAQEIAASKYKSRLYSGQLSLGYNYFITQNTSLTPMVGVIWSRFKDSGYKETGTTFQNLTVKKKAYNKLEGVLGFRAAKTIGTKYLTLVPELYGFINYTSKGKAPAVEARLDGIGETLPTIPFSTQKTSYNVGCSLTFKHKMTEYGFNYNANLASKYLAQQGSLKLKLHF